MDIELFYIEEGEGFPLLMLHGNGENCGYFEHQIGYFAGQYHVCALDTRGHGRSPRGSAPFSIAQFAQDLRDFMELYGIGRAHILGFSDGANIALAFALKYPEMVEKMILNGGNLFPEGVHSSVQIPIELGYHAALLAAHRSESARRKAEMLGLMVKEPHIDPARLHGLHIPTLVVAGTRDLIKKSHTELIYKSLPQAELSFIEGGHEVASSTRGRRHS